MHTPRHRKVLMRKEYLGITGHEHDLRRLRLSLLPWTRSLTHAVFFQASASITLLWLRRLGANAACLCCRTRSAGRAPSGAATRLWSVHLNSTLQTFVLAFTAKSCRLLGAYRCRTMRTPRKVKTTLISGVFEVGGKFGGVFLRILPAGILYVFGAYSLSCGQGCVSPNL
jgi:hypothetical protein